MTRQSKRNSSSSKIETVAISKRVRFSDESLENNAVNVSAMTILSFLSTSATSSKPRVRYSWDDFQNCILKDPNQVTDQLFLQALVIPKPLIPVKIISTMLTMKRDIICAESAKLLACMTWIPLNYVRRILILERNHVRDNGNELENKKKIWLKVFDSLNDMPRISPRLEVTEILFRWFRDDDDLWDSVLPVCSRHEENLPYLIQLLKMTSIRINGEFPESIQRKLCDIFIRKIVSSWEDVAVENALRILKSFNIFKAKCTSSHLAKSSVLERSFQRSLFRTSKLIMSVCPNSVLGFDPQNDPQTYPYGCNSSEYLGFILDANENLEEMAFEVLKCYIKLQIKLSLHLHLEIYYLFEARFVMNHECWIYPCGGLELDWYGECYSIIIGRKYSDYFEELFHDLIDYVMSFDIQGNKQSEICLLDPRWHLMSLLRCAVNSSFSSTIIQWAISKYPAILSSQASNDYRCGTLLHLLCYEKSTDTSMIQFVIERGVEYGIERGGLITKDDEGMTPLEILARRRLHSQKRILCDFLLNTASPKLIKQSDFTDIYLFHSICKGGQLSVAKEFIKVFPNILSIVDSRGQLPVHAIFQLSSVANRGILQLLLKEGLKQGIGKNQGGMAGLLMKDYDGQAPLDYITQKESLQRKSLVGDLYCNIPQVPLLAYLLACSSLYLPMPVYKDGIYYWAKCRFIRQMNIYNIIDSFSMSTRAPGPDGRLPIHIAIDKNFGEFGGESSLREYLGSRIDSGRSFSSEAYVLLRNDSSCLTCIDPFTGLYPFQMIASKEFFRSSHLSDRKKRIYALSEVFTMLCLDPSAVVRVGKW